MNRILKTVTAVALLISMIMTMTGCSLGAKADDLMEGVKKRELHESVDRKTYAQGMTDFAVRLTKTCNEADAGQNVLVSPLSVIMSLAMTANGAEGETLGEMEKTFGFTAGELNAYAHSYMKMLENLPEDSGSFELANSIWFPDDSRIDVSKDFLQINADHFDAEMYLSPFDDSTVQAVNAWVKEKTKEMIPEIISTVNEKTVMLLINALAFDCKWMTPYMDYDIGNRDFWVTPKKRRNVPFMYANEGVYLSDENAKGFIKYYKGAKFAFAALIPDEGTDVNAYLESLSGERLRSILDNAEQCKVDTAIPKFELEYKTELSDVMKKMGMKRAFDDEAAEFAGLGTAANGNVFIGSVLHKTYICLDENGTKASAVTATTPETTAAKPVEIKQVYLERPFIYMIMDTETKTPFFIGVMNTPDPEHP